MYRIFKFASIIYPIIAVPLLAYGTISFANHFFQKQQKISKEEDKQDKISKEEDKQHKKDLFSFKNTKYYIDCTGLNKYDVFAHLYNSSKPLGMGLLQGEYKSFDREQAKLILDQNPKIDYCKGRPIKINFETWPFLDFDGFDSRNGVPGTMDRLILELKNNKKISTQIPEPVSDDEFVKTMKDCGFHAVPKQNNTKKISLRSEINQGFEENNNVMNKTNKSKKYFDRFVFTENTFPYPAGK